MLNELYDLSLSLERAGITPTEWHPDLKELPKISKTKPCFKVYLAPDGIIAEIEPIEDVACVEGLRKWQSGANGYSFPCFNVRPLYKAYAGSGATDAEKKSFDEWLKGVKKAQTLGDDSSSALKSYVNNSNKLWTDDHNKRIAECLTRIPLELRKIIGEPPEEFSSIAALIERCSAGHYCKLKGDGEFSTVASLIERCSKVTADKFFQQLASLLEGKINKNPTDCDKYAGFLLHSGSKSPGNDIALVLELSDGLSAYSLPAVNSKVHRWINQRLLANKNDVISHSTDSSQGLDAFGLTSADWEDKLPEVNMPVLGGVKLRAMNFESPCQTRYRRIDATSFVVGAEVRKRAKGALEWLTDEEREDKTWGNVSKARDDKEVLLVYPSEIPKAPMAAVAMFGSAAMNTSTQTARFVDYAADVTNALRGIHRPLKDVEMRVFALRKMDKARTQVSCNRRYTAERLIAAASEWQTSCGNVPAIQIKQWGKEKGDKPEWHPVDTPFPLEVIWCLNTAWTQAAVEPTRVREFAGADGISLLLDEGVQVRSLLERALHATIRNGGNLLIALAHTQHQNTIHEVNGKYEKQKLLLPAILGLLLAKLGQTKEDYMKTAPYLIGRMLSLADQIHYYYCQKVRKDGKPPGQLMGNALMTTALEVPEQALALFAQRILPYHAWAKTVQGKDAGLARYFLKELGAVSSDMESVEMPIRCSDADKAQLLLGYLAWSNQSDQNGENQ
jgi:hypothetical protein